MDLLESESIERVIIDYRPEYILHLASFSSVAFSWKNPTLSFKNNVNIFLNLLEVLRKYGLHAKVLSIGSSEEYGNINADDLPLKETSRLDPISPYAVARVSQEMLSKLYADSFGQHIVMTRSFNHIGPGQTDAFVIPSFVKRILEAKLRGDTVARLEVGNVEIIRDFLDVRDVVKAYHALLHKGKNGEVYNVCKGSPVKLADILSRIGKLLDIPVEYTVNPDFVRPNDNLVIVGDNSKISADTGWTPAISLTQSLSDIIAYWRRLLEE